MTVDVADEAFRLWLGAMLAALATPDDVMAWQDRRYRFAYQVGKHLTSAAGARVAAVADHVVYGVYVTGGGLIYVGQSADARRRLRDLPVGESHHLATTVPPETWDRVVVVQWPDLLPGIPASEAQSAAQFGHKTCGLAIEHLLQITYRPVMTTRRRSTAGGWTPRRIDTSNSRGALASTDLPVLFRAVQEVWDNLAHATPSHGQAAVYMPAGRVVFPASLITQSEAAGQLTAIRPPLDDGCDGLAGDHTEPLDGGDGRC
jgi:hypothetical protein